MAVKSFDPATGRVELVGALAEPPKQGERVVVDFGSRLQSGRKHYMHHCMHCHGVTGDGEGPTAEYLNPRPRDYRLGIFKFTSTPNKEPPTREDLHRTIYEGIPGTYMPSFALLEPEVVDAIAEYVRWLSMRGVLEKELVEELGVNGLKFSLADIEAEAESLEIVHRAAVKRWEDGGRKGPAPEPPTSREAIRRQRLEEFQEFQNEELAGLVDDTGDDIARDWTQAELLATAILPDEPHTPSTPESRARGRLLYLRNDCQNCHGLTGEGNGPLTREFSENTETKEQNPTPGLFDVWGQPVQPRNLHSGIYRGGRRPLDVYRRIHAGISGTPMPTFGSKLSDAQIWDLVNYVMSIPYEDMATGAEPPATVADDGEAEPAEQAETAALTTPGAADR
jgi:mono/diheme cytochrome c family protein